MVLLIKNKHASFDNVAHLPLSSTCDAPSGRLAKLRLRNAGVPKAMSLPHISLLVEGGTLGAHCAAMLNADLHKLKPKQVIARRVKSAKEDLCRRFDSASLKQPAKSPSGSTSTELACSKTASSVKIPSSTENASPKLHPEPARPLSSELAPPRMVSGSGISGPLDSSFSLHTPDEKDEEGEDHIHRLTVIAQSWLDFERLFSPRRARSEQAIEEARHDFCQALVQSFSDSLSLASSLRSANIPSFYPVCSSLGYSPAPSATTWTNQTTLTLGQFESSVLKEDPNQSPEFSDEELQREFDNFSFHSSQDEEWTSEVDSRKQNAMNRALSDMKRQLSFPVPRFSSYFSDDSLADTAAHQTLVEPPSSRFSASSKEDDADSSYSADKEDNTEDDQDESVSLSITPLGSPVGTPSPVVNGAIPVCTPELCLSSQTDDPTPKEKQVEPELRIQLAEDRTEDVSETLVSYVPRLLERIPEEPLTDEYETETTAQPPSLPFRRLISQYRKTWLFKRQSASILPLIRVVDSTPASSMAETSAAPMDTVASPGKTLRRVGKFVDLKSPVTLPAVQSTSSIDSTCETISLHEDACTLEPQGRRLRRVPGCPDLREAFRRANMSLCSPSQHSPQGRSGFGERQCSPDLGDGHKVEPPSPRCPSVRKINAAKLPIPPKPPGFCSRQQRIQRSSAAIRDPSSLCSRCDPLSSLPLWSCAKITRSKGKRNHPPGESTKALRKRLDSIHIDPETVHGHPTTRDDEKFPPILSINSRRAKTFKIRKSSTATQHLKASQNKTGNFFWRP